jgi:hypothetical protein
MVAQPAAKLSVEQMNETLRPGQRPLEPIIDLDAAAHGVEGANPHMSLTLRHLDNSDRAS